MLGRANLVTLLATAAGAADMQGCTHIECCRHRLTCLQPQTCSRLAGRAPVTRGLTATRRSCCAPCWSRPSRWVAVYWPEQWAGYALKASTACHAAAKLYKPAESRPLCWGARGACMTCQWPQSSCPPGLPAVHCPHPHNLPVNSPDNAAPLPQGPQGARPLP